MLKLTKQFDPNDITILDMVIRGHVARDPETGVYMVASQGRRKAGRPTRYWVIDPKAGGGYRIKLTAYDDQEAVNKANEKLDKLSK